MKRTAYTRIIAALLAVASLFSIKLVVLPTLANSAELGSSLGASGSALGESGVETPSLGISEDEETPVLGVSTMFQADEAKTAGTLEELEAAIGTVGDVYVTLTNNITMTKIITISEGRKVTVDGDKKWKLIQYGSDVNYYFAGGQDTVVTLKDVEVEGRTQYGIIRSTGDGGTGVFDNVTYIGSQPYYGSGGNNEMIIRNGGYYEIKRQSGNSIEGQELNECARITFDGGKTIVKHAAASLPDRNTNAVFFMTNRGGGSVYIHLTNEADVTIESGNYVLYTSIGAVPIIMDDNTRLDITAAAFNRGTDGHRHPVGDFTMGENAYFSYKQQGSPNSTDAFKIMYINGNVSLGKNSTFLIDTTTYGLWHNESKTFTANTPRLVSIHGSTSAFYSLEGKAAGEWRIDNVNAVNYWPTKAAGAAPASDASHNWPTHMWNTWQFDGNTTYEIGPVFSFAANGVSGVLSGGETMVDVLGRHTATLKSTLRLDTGTQRLVFGNIKPFAVEKIRPYEGVINGSVLCDDVTAVYDVRDGGPVTVTRSTLPMDINDSPKPLPGGSATVVANMAGLRAAVQAEIDGTLELVAVPDYIHYGRHSAPGNTTVYHRKEISSKDADGNMLVEVLDTRGDTGGPWQLTVRAVDEALEGRELLPASALMFVTHAGTEYYLDEGPAPVYSEGTAADDYVKYPITWDDDHGLLVKVRRGQLAPGDYAAVLNWSVQNAP